MISDLTFSTEIAELAGLIRSATNPPNFEDEQELHLTLDSSTELYIDDSFATIGDHRVTRFSQLSYCFKTITVKMLDGSIKYLSI